MRILLIDNYDSFTYNLAGLLLQHPQVQLEVYRNDAIAIDEVAAFDKILFSPGPGLPSQAGQMPAIITKYASTKSMLGICLGHQAIAAYAGASLYNLPAVVHGIASQTHQLQPDPLFESLPPGFLTGRYHSWAVARDNLPETLEITAATGDGCIMALRHRQYRLRGLQFHPESVLTPHGATIIHNWIHYDL
jgi:anthranilate synthase component 2